MSEDAPSARIGVLLVDDQPDGKTAYAHLLEGLDAHLVHARTIGETLAHLQHSEFAVVLIDVSGTQIDHVQLAATIRQHPRCQRTSIVLVSAHPDHLRRVSGLESGAVDYVSVPVAPELLRAKVTVFADLYRKTTALEQLNRQLEWRVAERTAELQQELSERKRLQEALIDADRRKDEFLAVLAHELRNPLAPIQTAVDVMQQMRLDDPALAECRDVIGRQIEQLTRLVDDLLDVSRITRGKIRLDRRPLDLAMIVQRAVETQKPVLDRRRQRLVLDLPAEPLTVHGDLTRLSEALINLLSNSAKYTNDGGTITIQVRKLSVPRSDGGHTVAIRVRDTGVGIPPEMLSKVFDLFTQVDHDLHRARGGLGIGLSLVRRLVEMHGGQIDAYSEGIGKGCEFVMRLPLIEPVAATATPAERNAAALPFRRVLVVDDNRDAVTMLSRMLRMLGAEVETAYDGPQALHLAERVRPDMVLLDIGMPHMNGLEVARLIRAQPWGQDIFLVAQTGWGQAEDRRRTREAGFDEHVTKPVVRSELMRLMAAARSNVEQGQAAAQTPADSWCPSV